MKRTSPHVVLDASSQSMHCRHCDERWPLNLPAPVSDFSARVKAFLREHRECSPPEPSDVEVAAKREGEQSGESQEAIG